MLIAGLVVVPGLVIAIQFSFMLNVPLKMYVQVMSADSKHLSYSLLLGIKVNFKKYTKNTSSMDLTSFKVWYFLP